MRRYIWLAICLLGSADLLSPGGATHAAAFIVGTTADAPDQSPGDGLCSTATAGCSLRAAIQESNALPGPDNIVLPPGTYVLTISGRGEDAAATGDLDIIDDVSLTGTRQSRPVVDANHVDSGLDIKPGATVEIDFVIIENGGFPQSADRSGIKNQGNLTLRNSVIRNSIAPTQSIGGGGLFNAGVAVVEYSEITGNEAVYGGGVGNLGTMTIQNSTISGNTAWHLWGGGGVFNSGSMEIDSSTVSGNSASYSIAKGGGILNIAEGSISPTLTITNSTISGNSATGSSGDGGGIASIGTTLIPIGSVPAYMTITGSTIASNTAADQSGGIYRELSPGTVEMSVIAGNAPDNCGGGSISSGNIVSDTTCGSSAIVADPLLGPLANNGGPTQTHAPATGSPAIDAFDSPSCPATDQRGVTRPRDGDGDGQARCDVGALEVDLTINPADFDRDGALDQVELLCDAIPWDVGSIPERIDGTFAGEDDDGDTEIDEPLPPGAENYDCDGDGYKGSAEAGSPLCGNGFNDDGVVFGGTDDGVVDDGCPGGPAQVGVYSEAQFNIGSGDQDPCGGDGWPADLVSSGPSANMVTLSDLASFVAPAPKKLNTSPGDPGFSPRWDLVPGSGASANWIVLQDMASLVAGTTGSPPMLGGAKAFGGPVCPWAP